jgi:hypothetical protein
MIFLLIRHQQARSAILLSLSRKSTSNFKLFINLLSKTQLNQFNQVIVLSEVLIFITADGCAFYSISGTLQYHFLNILIECIIFQQNPFNYLN